MASRAFHVGIAVLALLLPAGTARGEWRSLRTESFVLLYPESYEETARELLYLCEDARPRVEALTGGVFRRFPLVIQDLGSYSNGVADPVLRTIRLYPYEFDAWSEDGFSQSPLRSLAAHELAHIGHLSASAGLPLVARTILGPALAPGLLSTRLLAEGIAIYAESWSSPFEGRLHEGYFDALIGVQAREGTLPSLARASYSEEGYPFGGGSYLYGAAFVRYLVSLGGEDALAHYLKRFSGSPASYLSAALPLLGADWLACRIWGSPMEALWDAWRRSEVERASGISEGRAAGSEGAAEITGIAASGDDLYYARMDELKTGRESAHVISRIVRLGPAGEEETVVVTPSTFTTPCVVRDGQLYYTIREIAGGFENVELSGWGLTSALRSLDLASGVDRELLRAPVRCFTVLPGGRAVYAVDRTREHGSDLFELLPDRSPPRLIRSFAFRILEMASDDRSLVICAREPGENTDLFRLGVEEMETGRPEPLVRSPWSEKTITLARGRLVYSANPDGRHGIYGIDLDSGERFGYDSGDYAIWPSEATASGTLYYVGPTSSGPRVMARPAARIPGLPVLSESGPGRREEPSVPAAVAQEVREGGAWPNLLTLVPRIRLPVVDTDFRSVRLGVWLAGESALGDLSYDLRGWYDPGVRLAGVDASLGVRIAAPVSLDAAYVSSAAHELAVRLRYTPFRRLQSGVSSAGLSLVATSRQTFSRLDLEPGLYLGYRAPGLSGGVRASVPLELACLGAAADRVGLSGSTWGSAVLLGGGLSWQLSAGWTSSGDSAFLPSLRGHLAAPSGSPGISVGLGYEHILLRIRDGLWNPAVYLGDLLVGVFAQSSVSSQEIGFAAGVEVVAEMRVLALGTGLPLALGGWAGVDERPGFIWGLIGTANMPSLGGRRPADGVP